MSYQPTVSVRTWGQATRDAQRYGEIRQLILAYIHPDSALSRDDVLNRIVRIVDTYDPPTLIGGTRIRSWHP